MANVTIARRPYHPDPHPDLQRPARNRRQHKCQCWGHHWAGLLTWIQKSRSGNRRPAAERKLYHRGVDVRADLRHWVNDDQRQRRNCTRAADDSLAECVDRIDVKEEFTSDDHSGSITFGINRKSITLKGPRRYLNVSLEPADDAERGGVGGLRNPTGPGDESLVMDNVRPGVTG